jgi:Spy/CpxP family protein refolding chaperone
MFLPTTMMLTVFLLGSVALSDPPADDLLAGPTIEEEEITSQDMTDRVLKEQGKSNKVGSRKQSRMWMTTLKVIDLTKDQEIEIHKIMAEYQKMNQIFQATHGEEIRSIREEHGKQGRDVLTTILIGAPKDQAAVPEASKKRMLELMELAPDVTTYQEKAWNLLTQEQQASFQKKYQELIDEEQKRKEERMKNDRPMGDEMQEGGFAPRDSKRKDRNSNSDDDTIGRHKDSVDEASLRRIKFLRRLQQLEKED